MTPPIIETPRGKAIPTKDGKVELVWNTNFRPRWQRPFSAAQRFMDSEVLRSCEPYTPLLTGLLIFSGILGTDVGSGLVQWIAPYAKARYYSPRRPGTQTGPLRGPYWFERMKAVDGSRIIAGAKKMIGTVQ